MGVSLHSSVRLRLQGYWKRHLLEFCTALRGNAPPSHTYINASLSPMNPLLSGLTVPQRPRTNDLCEGGAGSGVPAGTPQEWTSSRAVLPRPRSLRTKASVPWLSYSAQGFAALAATSSDPGCVTSSISLDYTELSLSSSVNGTSVSTHRVSVRLAREIRHTKTTTESSSGVSSHIGCYGFILRSIYGKYYESTCGHMTRERGERPGFKESRHIGLPFLYINME